MGEGIKETQLAVIEAQEVLSRIENGYPVIYDHVAIAGDLDIRRIDLPIVHCERPAGQDQTAYVVASRIQMRNCDLLGDVFFDHALFKECLDLSGCTFHKEARFKGASLSGGAKLESCRFHKYATFKEAYFAECARFQGAGFSAIANFGNAVFSCPAHFEQSRFSELCTNFGEAKILEDADFTEARFSGTANFRLVSFSRSVSFWRAAFLADAIFQGGKFSGYTSFQSAEISKGADFRGAVFDEELNFEFARLLGTSIFLGTSMKGQANFFRAEMNDVNFTEAVFSGDVLFSEASAGRAVFSGSQFQKNASFAGSRFREEAFFDQAVFSGTAQFSSTVFVAEVSLHAVLFCREAAFASSEFQSIARFDSARFQGGLDLSGAKIHIIRLRDAAVSGRIDLHNAEFMRLEARWPVLSHHLAYDGAAYLALVKNFRNLEWFEDADDCYYQYRRASQSAKGFFVRSGKRASINWAKLSDALAWISCGYGVRPRHTVFLSGILIVLFALIYWMGGGIVVEPLNGSGPSIGSQAALDFHDYLYFSAMVFTAKTQVKWYPVGIYRYIATIESVLGWLLLALFLVSLGRTMIR